MSNATTQPPLMTQIMQKMGMRDLRAEQAEQAERERQHREAQDAILLSAFLPYDHNKLVSAAKTAIEQWLPTLPPHRLMQPFYCEEIRLAVAHVLAAQGRKNTRLAPNTIGRALWQLGFTKHRAHGSTRPQTRFWLHPAARQTTTK